MNSMSQFKCWRRAPDFQRISWRLRGIWMNLDDFSAAKPSYFSTKLFVLNAPQRTVVINALTVKQIQSEDVKNTLHLGALMQPSKILMILNWGVRSEFGSTYIR